MSALGQKRTYAVHNGMSALPPKADICGAARGVRFGPKADISDKPKIDGLHEHVENTTPNYDRRGGYHESGIKLRPCRDFSSQLNRSVWSKRCEAKQTN